MALDGFRSITFISFPIVEKYLFSHFLLNLQDQVGDGVLKEWQESQLERVGPHDEGVDF